MARQYSGERVGSTDSEDDSLRQFKWLLESKQIETGVRQQPYGDLSELNCERRILDSLGVVTLSEIVSTFLDLTESSAVVYERNGDYAISQFESSWCRTINSASRNLCNGGNKEAMACGKWICHDYCWQSCRLAMKAGAAADIETVCGIRGVVSPIIGADKTIGAIIISYGTPPAEEDRLADLAAALQLPVRVLQEASAQYKARPPIIMELAKKHLLTAARLIGEMVARRTVQISLSESEFARAAIMETAPDPIIVLDLSGKIVDFNPAAERTFGHPRDCVLGAHVDDVILPAESNGNIDGRATDLLSGELLRAGQRRECYAMRSSGETFPAEFWLAEISRLGEPGFAAFVRDLTKQKESEENMRRLARLEQREDFVATLTHDVKNPLIGASRILELFLSGHMGELTDKQRDLLERLGKSNNQLLSQLNDLLLVYRLDQTQDYLAFARENLCAIVSCAVSELSPLAEAKNITLVSRLPETLLAQIDKLAIRRVVHNLLGNALKFTPGGGRIEVTLSMEEPYALLEIKDSGPGICAEDQKKIFHRFFKAPAGKRYEPGTGLGLYICRQLTEMHQGSIDCGSVEGQGATFTVKLPLQRGGGERVDAVS